MKETKISVPIRPYVFRAYYDWLVDSGFTPYLRVDSYVPKTEVPEEYVDQDGGIVLNISAAATGNFSADRSHIEFLARFGGKALHIDIPFAAVQALFAKENPSIAFIFADEQYYLDWIMANAEDTGEDGTDAPAAISVESDGGAAAGDKSAAGSAESGKTGSVNESGEKPARPSFTVVE